MRSFPHQHQRQHSSAQDTSGQGYIPQTLPHVARRVWGPDYVACKQNIMVCDELRFLHFQVVNHVNVQKPLLGNKANLGCVPMSLYPQSRSVSMTDEMVCSSLILKVPTIGQRNKITHTPDHVVVCNHFIKYGMRQPLAVTGRHPLVPPIPHSLITSLLTSKKRDGYTTTSQ